MPTAEDTQAALSYELAVYREQISMIKRETERVSLTTIDLANALRTVEGIVPEQALIPIGGGALVKGGHLDGDEVVDVLAMGGEVRRFTRPKLRTSSTHGTGCTLSAAIAAGLALGRPLERAVSDALDFVHRAIATAPGLGQGHGPLNHFAAAPES